MAAGQGKVPPSETPTVQYLQSGPDTPYTCWFLVGHTHGKAPELIAGCKLHMMAYSDPLRKMLYESELAEEGSKQNPVEIPDVKPDTFRNFVKYINFGNLPTVSLEEAVDLVCLAEKYIVEDLKPKLGQHIAPLLNVNNVFVPLKHPECLLNEHIKNAIDKIVREDTKELFDQEEFLELSSAEVLHIVTQDTLAVTELELWREILRWAKHTTESEEVEELRTCISELLKHIRFCTLDVRDFCVEVVSTGILTATEVFSINMVFGGKLSSQKSSSLCYELSARNVMIKNQVKVDLIALGLNERQDSRNSSYIFITTDAKGIQLLRGELKSLGHFYRCAPSNLKLCCKCQVSLSRITDYGSNTSSEPPVQFEFQKDVDYNSTFIMPFTETMTLQPYNKFKLQFNFNKFFETTAFISHWDKIFEHRGLRLSWDGPNYPRTHLRWFEYKTL